MKLEPYVRFAMNHIWLENYYINREIWDHEFIFIEDGKLKITIGNNVYHAMKNDLVILRPHVPHVIEWDNENCNQPHVHFDFIDCPDKYDVPVSMIRYENMTEDERKFFRNDFFSENGIDIPDVVHLKEPQVVRNILHEIINEFTFKKEKSEIILQGLMTQLIGTILRENESNNLKNESSEELNQAIVFMNENVDKNLSLDDIANRLGISKWSLIQLFNNRFKQSPMKYYNKLRHLRAKDLLMYSCIPIRELSRRMGFNEPQTFSRWFKNMDGNYPSIYRKQK